MKVRSLHPSFSLINFIVVFFIHSIAISSQNSSPALSSPAGRNRVCCLPCCGLEYWSGIYAVLQVQSSMMLNGGYIICKGKTIRMYISSHLNCFNCKVVWIWNAPIRVHWQHFMETENTSAGFYQQSRVSRFLSQ